MKMTIQDAYDFLFIRRAKGMKLGLDNIRKFLNRLDHPEKKFPSVHIAGTNGKGSTAAILESILREAGYRTGLYTSPHLYDMRERIKIRGTFIEPDTIIDFLEANKSDIEKIGVSFFEILTAMAFRHFSENEIDIAVLETGLGGRLDATTTVTPVLTMITEIGMDHTHILGNSLASITREKAGILKSGIPCVTRNKNKKVRDVLTETAGNMHIPMLFSDDLVRLSRIRCTLHGSTFDAVTPYHTYSGLHLKLLGRHQIENAATAYTTLKVVDRAGIAVPDEAIQKGFAQVRWPGRFEVYPGEPVLVFDGAHNRYSAKMLAETVEEVFPGKPVCLVFGASEDKDIAGMFAELLPKADHLLLVKADHPRAATLERLVELASAYDCPYSTYGQPADFYHEASRIIGRQGVVLVTGSLYVVGQLSGHWQHK